MIVVMTNVSYDGIMCCVRMFGGVLLICARVCHIFRDKNVEIWAKSRVVNVKIPTP